jgi:UDP-N-acetylmuramate dehydrogenase
MDIHTNIPLNKYVTMKLGGPARFLAEARSPQEVAELYKNALAQSLPVFVLGGGSNLVVGDSGFAGLVMRIRIPGFEIINDDINTTTIKIGAGESWDGVVKRTVDMHLSGIETMSGIPGTVGGVPITNVGAYGQEIADTLQSVDAFDTQTQTFVMLTNEQCGFSYRHSIFRGESQNRFIITSVTLTLSKNSPTPPFYDTLQKYLDEHSITIYTQQAIRDAVLAIRADKLPDPTLKPNAGSFFKNAIVEQWQLGDLQAKYPDMPIYDMGDGHSKIPSGWLIEKVGLKGQLMHGMRVHDGNALVLVNEAAANYADLAAARDEIVGKVRDTFRIQLEQEPLEV